MKKKLLSLMMATCMVAMVLTGCGQKEATGDDVKASVEESKESKEEPKEETKEEVKESEETSEEVTEVTEESEEVMESTEEVEETEEVVESKEAEETEEVVVTTEESDEEEIIESEEVDEEEVPVVDENGVDWSKAYDDYFENPKSLEDNFMLDCTAFMDDICVDMVVAVSGDTVQMSYNLEAAQFDLYATKEKAYVYWEAQGQNGYAWAPVESEEDINSLVDTSDYGIIDPETIESCTYRESIEDDGVIFDVLDVVTKDGVNNVYFINRESQNVEKITIDDGETTAVCMVKEIESIEIPEEALNSEETTMDEVAMTMLGILMMAAYGTPQ